MTPSVSDRRGRPATRGRGEDHTDGGGAEPDQQGVAGAVDDPGVDVRGRTGPCRTGWSSPTGPEDSGRPGSMASGSGPISVPGHDEPQPRSGEVQGASAGPRALALSGDGRSRGRGRRRDVGRRCPGQGWPWYSSGLREARVDEGVEDVDEEIDDRRRRPRAAAPPRRPRGRSRPLTAVTRTRPRPGRARSFSTMTAAVIVGPDGPPGQAQARQQRVAQHVAQSHPDRRPTGPGRRGRRGLPVPARTRSRVTWPRNPARGMASVSAGSTRPPRRCRRPRGTIPAPGRRRRAG